MKNYKMLRGQVAENRCTNKGTWGSPLYCECGCQTPRDTDPDINLTDVIVTRQASSGYADFTLSRNGQDCGNINTQYGAICLDGNEFLGVDRDHIQHLISAALAIDTTDTTESAGSTPEEESYLITTSENIAIDEQDERNASHPGYCTKCHSYCYGDCEAS